MPIKNVEEGTTAYLTVEFKDKNGNLDTPSSVSYRIDCLTNSQEIKSDTSLTPASSIEIELTATDNAIINQNNNVEKRLVTVKATYGAGDGINDEYEYNVQNLRKVT